MPGTHTLSKPSDIVTSWLNGWKISRVCLANDTWSFLSFQWAVLNSPTGILGEEDGTGGVAINHSITEVHG